MFLDHADADGDAFTDAKSWWDGLGCEAMVEAVNDDRTADMTNPFCKPCTTTSWLKPTG